MVRVRGTSYRGRARGKPVPVLRKGGRAVICSLLDALGLVLVVAWALAVVTVFVVIWRAVE